MTTPNPTGDALAQAEGFVREARHILNKANEKLIDLQVQAARTPPPSLDEVAEVLRIFMKCAYPVSTEINPRGHDWCEAYLDEALEEARALLTRPSVSIPQRDDM